MESILLLKSIMEDVQKELLKNEQPYIILEGYEYFRDIITLYAKQHNLIESTLLLVENKMYEEAIVLARSVLNNYFLIGYILKKPNKNIKEYHIQPAITKLYFLKNLINIMKGTFCFDLDKAGKKLPYTIDDIKKEMMQLREIIKKAGFSENMKPISIRKLAKEADLRGLEIYSTLYSDASKYEHSDFSSLEIYKRNIDDISNNQAFVLDMNRTDEDLNNKILSMVTIAYFETYLKVVKEIFNNNKHLKEQYNEDILKIIFRKVMKYINCENI